MCVCGYSTTNSGTFGGHLLWMGRKEPGKHKSKGLVDIVTGEVAIPPVADRTPDDVKEVKKISGKESAATKTQSRTSTLRTAMQLQFVPRTYTMDYSPILRAGQEAAVKVWGWPIDIPLGDFLDTIVYYFFKDRNVTLAGFIVEETEEEKVAREQTLERTDGHGSGQVIPESIENQEEVV